MWQKYTQSFPVALLFFANIVVVCPELDVPDNGDIEYGTIPPVYNSAVSYSCDNGYILEGNKVRMCQRNGMWSGFAPICKRK